jgi:DNA polymerase epsilon subunit 2
LEFIEKILDQHDIPDDQVEQAVEWIAKEYNKQDGEAL